MKRHRRTNAQMNVVPYIDVMLVLLVIFMVTAPLLQPGVVNLPKVGQAAAVEASPLEIIISRKGGYELRDSQSGRPAQRRLSLDELSAALQQTLASGPRPVLIAAERSVAYGEVMRVVDHLQKQQIARVGLLVNSGE